MVGKEKQRFVSMATTLIVLVGVAARGFSEEPTYSAEFFSQRGADTAIDAPAPLFAMDAGGEKLDANLRVRASAAASARKQFEPASGARRGFGRSPFETEGNALFTTMGIGMFVAAAGDFATTEMGLATPGIIEMNPVQGNRGVRIATHIVAPAFVYWATERARKKGNTKLALLIRIGANVAYSYAAMHNARTLAGHP